MGEQTMIGPIREIDEAVCRCGGVVQSVETTQEEEYAYGCTKHGCCVMALECSKCGARFTLALMAPDINW